MSRNRNNNKDKNKKNITNKKLDCSNNHISPLIINKKQNNRKLFLLIYLTIKNKIIYYYLY